MLTVLTDRPVSTGVNVRWQIQHHMSRISRCSAQLSPPSVEYHCVWRDIISLPFGLHNIIIYLFTAIGLLPGGGGYFTCTQNKACTGSISCGADVLVGTVFSYRIALVTRKQVRCKLFSRFFQLFQENCHSVNHSVPHSVSIRRVFDITKPEGLSGCNGLIESSEVKSLR